MGPKCNWKIEYRIFVYKFNLYSYTLPLLLHVAPFSPYNTETVSFVNLWEIISASCALPDRTTKGLQGQTCSGLAVCSSWAAFFALWLYVSRRIPRAKVCNLLPRLLCVANKRTKNLFYSLFSAGIASGLQNFVAAKIR